MTTFDVTGDGVYAHEAGNTSCKEGWCGNGWPFPCVCGGLVHADLLDEDEDGFLLSKKCDRCGHNYAIQEQA